MTAKFESLHCTIVATLNRIQNLKRQRPGERSLATAFLGKQGEPL